MFRSSLSFAVAILFVAGAAHAQLAADPLAAAPVVYSNGPQLNVENCNTNDPAYGDGCVANNGPVIDDRGSADYGYAPDYVPDYYADAPVYSAAPVYLGISLLPDLYWGWPYYGYGYGYSYWPYYGYGCCNATLQGAVTTDATQIGVGEIDYTTGNNTFGLSGVFSLTCNYDFLICNNKDLLTSSLLYCLGAEAMIYRQASDRLNKFTTIDAEKAAKLQEYFSQEFENELRIVLDGVRLSTDDACIDCNTQIEILTATP